MNVVYILFKRVNENRDSSYFIVDVYKNEEDAYNRKAQMFESEKYFVEEWEVTQ